MSDLDKRLLRIVIASPRAALSAAVALGMTIALEMSIRRRLDVIKRIEGDTGVRDSVVQLVLEQWVYATRNNITDKQFKVLCDRIVGLASAS
jgi:hypothetical protein